MVQFNSATIFYMVQIHFLNYESLSSTPVLLQVCPLGLYDNNYFFLRFYIKPSFKYWFIWGTILCLSWLYCGGNPFPYFGPSDGWGTVPNTLRNMMFLSIKFVCSSNFFIISSYMISFWWFSVIQKAFRPITGFRNHYLTNQLDD